MGQTEIGRQSEQFGQQRCKTTDRIVCQMGIRDVSLNAVYSQHAAQRPAPPNPYQVEHDDLFASIRLGNPINEAERGVGGHAAGAAQRGNAEERAIDRVGSVDDQ